MPTGKVVVEIVNPSYGEAVDVVASTELKERHKPYGEMIRRLAEVIRRELKPRRGEWQKVWSVATKVFGYLYRGYSVNEVRGIATALGRAYGVNGARILDVVSKNIEYILGGENAKPEISRGGARR